MFVLSNEIKNQSSMSPIENSFVSNEQFIKEFRPAKRVLSKKLCILFLVGGAVDMCAYAICVLTQMQWAAVTKLHIA